MSRLTSRDLALVATFAGVIAALGLVPGFLPTGVAVPITAQTLGVMLAGSIIGARRGSRRRPALPGARGARVSPCSPEAAAAWASWSARPSATSSAGSSAACVIGFLSERRRSPYDFSTGFGINVIGGILVIHAFGLVGLMVRLGLSLEAAIATDLWFILGDLVKAVIAASVARRRPPRLPRPPRGQPRVPGSSPAPDPVAAVLAARDEGRDLTLATSGTTGAPRTVVRTHGVLVGVVRAVHRPVRGHRRLAGLGAGPADRHHEPVRGRARQRRRCQRRRARPGDARLPDAGPARPAPRPAPAGHPGDAWPATPSPPPWPTGRSGPGSRSRTTTARPSCRSWPAVVTRRRSAPSRASRSRSAPAWSWVRSPYTAAPGWQTVGDTGTWDGHRLRLTGRPGTVTTAGATVVLADVEAALDGRVTCFGVVSESVGEVLAAAVTDSESCPRCRRWPASRLSPRTGRGSGWSSTRSR